MQFEHYDHDEKELIKDKTMKPVLVLVVVVAVIVLVVISC